VGGCRLGRSRRVRNQENEDKRQAGAQKIQHRGNQISFDSRLASLSDYSGPVAPEVSWSSSSLEFSMNLNQHCDPAANKLLRSAASFVPSAYPMNHIL
jgi:hypothetical protein